MIEIQIKLKELMPKNQGRSFNGSSHGKKAGPGWQEGKRRKVDEKCEKL